MKAFMNWLSEVLAEPRKSLPFSLVANMLLVVVLLSGSFVSFTWDREHGLSLRPPDRSPRVLLQSLISDKQTWLEASEPLLEALKSLKETDPVTQALRLWSQNGDNLFASIWREKVRITLSDSTQEGTVTFCEMKAEENKNNLQDMYLFVMFYRPVEKDYEAGVYDVPLHVTEKMRPCKPDERFHIQINRADWSKVAAAHPQLLNTDAQSVGEDNIHVQMHLRVPYPYTQMRSCVTANPDKRPQHLVDTRAH